MKYSTFVYLIIGLISLAILGVFATAYYGSGLVYIGLIVFGSFVSVFFVTMITNYTQAEVEQEFGEETVGEIANDTLYRMSEKYKRFRDKIVYK